MTTQPLSLIKIYGDDAASFLQGQLTNDVAELDGSSRWQYAGYCSPKGRLLALLMLWRIDNEFFALLNADISEPTVKRLRMFVLRSKVVIEEMHTASIDLSSQATQRGELTVSKPESQLGFGSHCLIVEHERASQRDFPTHQWLNLQVKEGLPCINQFTQDTFVPQMVNLDLLGGINFKKGCYTGQEIVARMHYLGKLKQRMFVGQISGVRDGITSGDKITTAEGKNAGTLVSIDREGACLAVLRLELINELLELATGATLNVNTNQPYLITELNDSDAADDAVDA